MNCCSRVTTWWPTCQAKRSSNSSKLSRNSASMKLFLDNIEKCQGLVLIIEKYHPQQLRPPLQIKTRHLSRLLAANTHLGSAHFCTGTLPPQLLESTTARVRLLFRRKKESRLNSLKDSWPAYELGVDIFDGEGTIEHADPVVSKVGHLKVVAVDHPSAASPSAAQPPSWGLPLQGQDAAPVQIHRSDGPRSAEEVPKRLNLVTIGLSSSVRSLESKFLAARDRLKININANNLEYLTFKFMANIRPRSEMLIRAKVPYTSEDIVEYLKCS